MWCHWWSASNLAVQLKKLSLCDLMKQLLLNFRQSVKINIYFVVIRIADVGPFNFPEPTNIGIKLTSGSRWVLTRDSFKTPLSRSFSFGWQMRCQLMFLGSRPCVFSFRWSRIGHRVRFKLRWEEPKFHPKRFSVACRWLLRCWCYLVAFWESHLTDSLCDATRFLPKPRLLCWAKTCICFHIERLFFASEDTVRLKTSKIFEFFAWKAKVFDSTMLSHVDTCFA